MTDTTSTSVTPLQGMAAWWPVLLGLAILYVPTVITLYHGAWQSSEGSHGFIVLAVILWIFWQQKAAFSRIPLNSSPALGWALLVPGLLLYALGRSQDILLLEVGSVLLILPAALLACHGKALLRSLWFPVLFLVFLVPLPGFVVDGLTGSLKLYVSIIVDQLLYTLGYPIGRSGVVLTMGPYQLMVADACSGINSMFSLSAIGVLYVYLRGKASRAHNILLLLSILPIAFLANVGRVIALVLITYYFGDGAGEGFTHDFASIVEFVFAVLGFILVDVILARWIFRRRAA